MAKISGILKDPIGQPMTNCIIELKSQINTVNVLRTVTSSVDTSNTGAYNMEVYPGIYEIVLRCENKTPLVIGSFTVFDNSDDGSLNDFFMLSNGIDFNSELLSKFKAIADEIAQNLMSAENLVEDVKEIQQQVYKQSDDVSLSISNANNVFDEIKVAQEFITTSLDEAKNQVILAETERDKAVQAAAMPVDAPGFYQVGNVLMAVPNSLRVMEPGETIDAASMLMIHYTTKNDAITYSFAKTNFDGIWRANGKSYYTSGSDFGPALFVRIS